MAEHDTLPAEPRKYKMYTLDDMSLIPEDALPRFIDELPHILKARAEVLTHVPEMLDKVWERSPWYIRMLGRAWMEKQLVEQINKAGEWCDDRKREANVRLTTPHETLYADKMPYGDAPEIARTLVLSTSHLTEATCNGYLHTAPFAVFEKGEYGWFVYVIDDYPEGMPPGLAQCFSIARGLGCEWIMFDRDGPVMDFLPAYEW